MQLGYNIVWDGFTDHVQGLLRDLYEFDHFTDVTIVCDDQKMLKAHRFILNASSDMKFENKMFGDFLNVAKDLKIKELNLDT